MTPPEQRGTGGSSLPQRLTYAELMWNRLHRAGWRMKHTADTADDGLSVRHLLHARKSIHSIELSAPTFTSAVMQVMSLASALEGSPGAPPPGDENSPVSNPPENPADSHTTESAMY